MHSAGWAFAWEFWSRYRILSALALANLLGLVLLVNLFPAGTFDPEGVASGTMPLWGIVLLILAGAHGEKADILARESPYPGRLFALPVRTTALVGWPMAIAGSSAALLWLILAAWVLRAAGAPVPLLWPAAFLAAFVVWIQALLWCPFPLPALRVVVAVPIMGGMLIGAALCHVCQAPPALLTVAWAAMIPAAYVVAVAGLTRARRGDTPVWHWPIFHDRASSSSKTRPAFAGAADALFWLDWRRNGYVLPSLLSLMLLPELLAMLYFGSGSTPQLTAGIFVGSVVVIPVVMSAAAGASLGNTHPWATDHYAMPAFSAVRPVTSGEIIAVKLRVAVRLFLAGGAVSLLLIVLFLPFSEVGATLADWLRSFIAEHGTRGWAMLVAGVMGLALLNLKAIVDHLFVGLTGRIWLNVALGVSFGGVAIATASVIAWLASNPDCQPGLLSSVPWVVGIALALKLVAGVLVTCILLRRGLVAPKTLARFAVVGLVAAAVLVSLAIWLVPPEICSAPIAACAAILLGLPMVRPGLAPLALDWNRHR